jgi:hypothetical protein
MSNTEPLPTTQPLSPPEEPKADEVAELRKDVEMLKEHLAALEALVLKITERMGGETRQ